MAVGGKVCMASSARPAELHGKELLEDLAIGRVLRCCAGRERCVLRCSDPEGGLRRAATPLVLVPGPKWFGATDGTITRTETEAGAAGSGRCTAILILGAAVGVLDGMVCG